MFVVVFTILKFLIHFLLQLGDDSKDVKVGEIIALLAEAGEDWKTVHNREPSATAGSKQDKQPVPVVADHSKPADPHHPSRKPMYLYMLTFFQSKLPLKVI